jgi:hypothetical protein
VMRNNQPAPPAQPSVAETRQRFADETMELPIFRELESAWFRTRDSTSEDTSDAPSSSGQSGVQVATMDTTMGASSGGGETSSLAPVGSSQQAAARPGEASTGSWQTAADDGWRAAVAASRAPATETTQTGLPKRVPMAQLVPGGVDKPASSVQRRTPEAVRGLLSAYHRGVHRGRTRPTDDHSTSPEATPGGQQSRQADPGPAAGSGQKEH